MNTDIQDVKNIKLLKIYKVDINKKTYFMFKRIIDVLGGIIGCVILIPLTFVIWLSNIITKDYGPVFYIQERIGKNGKIFKMYKYRSMVEEADELLEEQLLNDIEIKKEYDKFKKIKNDPRVTKVGRIIRIVSLDEFPQFINVLKGEMSLVGPRPYLLTEKNDMEDAYREIIKVKPGITGPWQIGGRNNITFKDRINIEKKYPIIANLKYDMKILFKTLFTVLNYKGSK